MSMECYYMFASHSEFFYVCLGFATFSLILLISHLFAIFAAFHFNSMRSCPPCVVMVSPCLPFSTAKPARRNQFKQNLPSVKMVLLLLQLDMYMYKYMYVYIIHMYMIYVCNDTAKTQDFKAMNMSNYAELRSFTPNCSCHDD